MSTNLHQADRQITGPLHRGAPKGTQEWGCDGLGSCKTCVISGHQMDLSKARVVDAHPHTQTHCLLESWHIHHEQASLNRGRGTMPGLQSTPLDWHHSLCMIFFIYIIFFLLIFVKHYYHVLSVSIILFPALLYSRFTFISRDLSPSVCHTVFIQ